MRRTSVLAFTGAILALVAGPAATQNTLSNTPGPGTLSVMIDGWGMFGSCTVGGVAGELNYTNTAGAGPFPTCCSSLVLLVSPTLPAPGSAWLATNYWPGGSPGQATNPTLISVGGNPRHLRTTVPALVGGFTITIDHELLGPDPVSIPPVEGSTLRTTYTMTNTTANPVTFSLIRHFDGDLGPVGGPGSYWTNDRAGASRRLADCALGAPPFQSNKEWIFEYDTTEIPGTMVALSCEGVDQAGAVVRPFSFEAVLSATGHPVPAFFTNPVGFLTGTVQGDTDLNLLTDEGGGGDMALYHGLTFNSVPASGTVRGLFLTRLTSMNAASATAIERQARDVTCARIGGNYSGGPAPLLCVNGSGSDCVNVGAGTPINLQLRAPGGGPAATHYVLYAGVGQPQTGAACGSPQAGDFAVWGGGISPFGLGSFPVTGALGFWTGGGAATGFAIVSSIPGIGLLYGPVATGAACPGTVVVSLPGILPNGFSFTVQAIVFDLGVAGPVPVSLSNAVTATVGSCPCPMGH